MKAYEVQPGSKSVADSKLVERPDPKPAFGEILVRIRATSLNFRDQMVVEGMYGPAASAFKTIPLSDGAGEVIATGEGVTRFKIGDRVASTFFRDWLDGPPRADARVSIGAGGVDGVLSEYAVFHAQNAVAIPAGFTFEEAAALPCAAVTAWHALTVVGAVRAGETVLLIGTGGVSVFALQFAHAMGSRVVLISSSDEKLERARSMGANVLINYKRTPDWEKEVLKATDGRGVDCIVEVGGPGTLARSMEAVGFAGRIALIGAVAGFQGETNPRPLMRKGASIHGIFVGSRAMFENMNAAIEVNGIKPVIDRVFSFDQTIEAYRYLKSAAHFGKIVIRV